MSKFSENSPAAGASPLKPGEPRLTLAAFGKHPGWDDDIPGIGIQTDTLAFVKQSLYVGGISGQIESGEWKRVDSVNRLEGFDHVFLWLRDGHVIVGRLWSSTDGKGGKEYPMVVCVDGEGIDLSGVLFKSANELEQLHEVCLNTNSADQVSAACKTAQDRLRASAAEPTAPTPGMVPPRDVRERFLNHELLGPNHVGLQRILHQLDGVAVRNARSCHLRLPLIGDSHGQALQVWSAFLQTAISKSLPLLFIIRAGVDWLDVIVGEPAGSDWFCLQASSVALPPATEIPCELAPESSGLMQTLMQKFLDGKALAVETAAKAAAPSPVPSIPESRKGRVPVWMILLALLGLAVVGGAGYWYITSQKQAASLANATAQATAASEQQEHYNAAMRDGQAALGRGDYTNAWLQAGAALNLRPGDAAATKLKSDIQAQMADAAQKADTERRFQAALAAAQLAFDHMDFTESLAQANTALRLKPGDEAAGKLRSQAQQLMTLAAEADANDWRLQAAMTAGQDAYDKGDYQEALAQANIALGVKADDPAAAKLKSQTQAQIELAMRAAENDRKFQAALAAAQTAYGQTNFAAAIAQADVALGLKPGEPAATKLKGDAEEQIALAAQMMAAPKNQVDLKSPVALKEDQAPAPALRDLATYFTNGIGMEFILAQDSNGREVLVAKYEVTQKQFKSVMGRLPGGQAVKADDFPVTNVPFKDAEEFCTRMGDQDGKSYYLPTEAEWLAVSGLPPNHVDDAWDFLRARGALDHEVTSLGGDLTSPERAGSRGAGFNGLCDFFGNVREWVKLDDGGVCAGFAYASGNGSTNSLFLDPKQAGRGVIQTTGFRCFLQDSR